MSEWNDIATAPKDGQMLLLWSYGRHYIGSWRIDEGFGGSEPTWLDNSHDDFSCGYASLPLRPTHWASLTSP